MLTYGYVSTVVVATETALFSTLFFLPGWFFFYAIIGGVVGGTVESWIVFFTILVVMPIPTHIFFQKRRFRLLENMYNKMSDAALEALPHVDYYLAGWDSSISMDVKSKTIAVRKFIGHKSPLKEITIPLGIITSVKAFAPGHQTIEIVGVASTVDTVDVARKNIEAKDKAALATGLYIYCDDIVLNKVFITMTIRAAERWVRAIEKLQSDTLSTQEYPADILLLESN